MMIRNLILILGDQLSTQISGLQGADPTPRPNLNG